MQSGGTGKQTPLTLGERLRNLSFPLLFKRNWLGGYLWELETPTNPRSCKQTTFMVICDLESDLHSVGNENILLFSDSKVLWASISIKGKSLQSL